MLQGMSGLVILPSVGAANSLATQMDLLRADLFAQLQSAQSSSGGTHSGHAVLRHRRRAPRVFLFGQQIVSYPETVESDVLNAPETLMWVCLYFVL